MIYKKIEQFRRNKQLFCTPGHKGKMPRFFNAEIDITELSGTDNLYSPSGIIKEAQDKAAKIFGANELLFLTSGATQGIFAMLGAFKNKRVIIPRNSHKSIFEACQTFNIEPVFASTGFSSLPDNGCAVTTEEKPVYARLVTFPDYYGNTIDIKSIYGECKREGIYLLVDAAHGSHFGFSKHLPESAVKYSDACVLSAHKTLPVLTQGAYLCINNENLSDDIKRVYRSLGTTSPSYPIMASLDYAAEYLKTHGEKNFEKLFKAVQEFKQKLPPQIKFCDSDDFTRIVLEAGDGFELEKKLNALGVYPEFADFTKAVFILSVCDSATVLRRLIKHLGSASLCLQTAGRRQRPATPTNSRAMLFLEAGNSPREYIDISAAVDGVAAGEIGFYPPGIPLVVRGEVLTREICDIMTEYRDRLFGLYRGKVCVVK